MEHDGLIMRIKELTKCCTPIIYIIPVLLIFFTYKIFQNIFIIY